MSKLANLHHPTNSGSGKRLPLTSMGTPNTGPVGNVGMKRLPELMNNGKPMTTRRGLLEFKMMINLINGLLINVKCKV